MNISRRGILTGAVASIFMPGIVRADSLMKLTGVPLDPWVLSYEFSRRINDEGRYRKGRFESAFNFNCSRNPDGSMCRNPLSYLKKVESGGYPVGIFPDLNYKIVRMSECDELCYPKLGGRHD